MKRLILFLISLSAFGACASSWTNGYEFCREIVIDHTKVPSTQTNFPVAVCIGSGAGANCSSNAKELATAANGGRLINSSGYDFIFTSDNAGTTGIPYDRAYQDITTGDAELHVRVSSLSSSVDTMIYLFYRNSAITTDQANPTAVWDANYLGVYHFPLKSGVYAANMNSVPDSTGARPEGPPNDTSAPVNGASGILGGGATFATSGSLLELTPAIEMTDYSGLPSGSQERMLEIWAIPNLASTNQFAFCEGNNSNNQRYAIFFTTSNGWAIEGTNTNATFSGGTTVAWHHIVIGLPSGQTTFGASVAYVDGASQTVSSDTDTVNTSLTATFGRSFQIGEICGIVAGNFRFLGTLDEARISNIVRSSDWIAAEYNNISNPSTFYSLGAEAGGTSSPGGPRPVVFR